ncbi:MAG TPA: hypothetical protein VLN45_06860 [Ignavibacteriaceae bacterium]|nr:hypothetical protein [Ignavibacteriaceae bacterium]
MKKHFFLILVSFVSLSFIISSCSSDEQEISPLSTQVEKSISSSFPYQINQVFAEAKLSKFDYSYSPKGLTITVNPLVDLSAKQLFAVIEFAEISDPVVTENEVMMVFLGKPFDGKYTIPGLTQKTVVSFNAYIYSDKKDDVSLPYLKSQVFNKQTLKSWTDAVKTVKVSSETFPSGLKQSFVQLISKEKTELVFLGKPYSTDFEFPKDGTFNLENLRVFNYSISVRDPN